MPRSRSRSIESSTCACISRSCRPPQIWMKRSASVDLPWSMCAMIEKLRISFIGAGTPARRRCKGRDYTRRARRTRGAIVAPLADDPPGHLEDRHAQPVAGREPGLAVDVHDRQAAVCWAHLQRQVEQELVAEVAALADVEDVTVRAPRVTPARPSIGMTETARRTASRPGPRNRPASEAAHGCQRAACPASPATPSALPAAAPSSSPRQRRQVDRSRRRAGPRRRRPRSSRPGRACSGTRPLVRAATSSVASAPPASHLQGAAPAPSAGTASGDGRRRRCAPGRPGLRGPGPRLCISGATLRRSAAASLHGHHRRGDVAHRLERHLAHRRDDMAVHARREGVGRTDARRLRTARDPTGCPAR